MIRAYLTALCYFLGPWVLIALVGFGLWSYALAAVGIVGLALAGRDRSVGWLIGLGAQGLWIAYALATGQYGFLVSALAYGYVYARNWHAWRGTGR